MKRTINALISLGITALLLFVIFKEQSPGAFLELILKIDTSYFFAYLVLSITALIARAVRYQLVLAGQSDGGSDVGMSKMLIVTAVRNALVDFFPARLGESVFFYILARFGIPLISTVTAFGMCLALDLVVLGYIIALAIAASPLSGESIHLPLLAILSVSVLACYFLYRIDSLVRFFSGIVSKRKFSSHKFVARALRALEKIAAQLSLLKENKRFVSIVLLTAFLRAAKYLSLYFLLIAVLRQWGLETEDVGVLITASAFIAAEASASLPVSGLMGFGAYEGAWAAIFALSGIALPEGVTQTSIIFAVHLITQIIGYSIGLLGFLAFLVAVRFSNASADSSN